MENPFNRPPLSEYYASREEHHLLKQEVDALQVEAMSRQEKWYRSPSVIVSGLALCFSLATTMFSYQREDAADARAARVEMRSILQRLIELPIEHRRFLKDFPGERYRLAGNYQEEATLLVDQVSRIASRYPEMLSATEYYALAMASDRTSLASQEREFLQLAMTRAPDQNVRQLLLRALATERYEAGDSEAGRRFFEQALNMWSEYPDTPREEQVGSQGFTQILWAEACAEQSDYRAALGHCGAALRLAESLPNGSIRREITALTSKMRQEYTTSLHSQEPPSMVTNGNIVRGGRYGEKSLTGTRNESPDDSVKFQPDGSIRIYPRGNNRKNSLVRFPNVPANKEKATTK